jgi:hypothetical protein
MTSYIPILILVGLALFILRSQLLRIAMVQSGGDMAKVHASAMLGATSGWASLLGALALMAVSVLSQGLMWGTVLIFLGLVIGVIASSLFLPLLGSTHAMGHLGGEGQQSIAGFNKLYGHHVAFSVAICAILAFLLMYAR